MSSGALSARGAAEVAVTETVATAEAPPDPPKERLPHHQPSTAAVEAARQDKVSASQRGTLEAADAAKASMRSEQSCAKCASSPLRGCATGTGCLAHHVGAAKPIKNVATATKDKPPPDINWPTAERDARHWPHKYSFDGWRSERAIVRRRTLETIFLFVTPG